MYNLVTFFFLFCFIFCAYKILDSDAENQANAFDLNAQTSNTNESYTNLNNIYSLQSYRESLKKDFDMKNQSYKNVCEQYDPTNSGYETNECQVQKNINTYNFPENKSVPYQIMHNNSNYQNESLSSTGDSSEYVNRNLTFNPQNTNHNPLHAQTSSFLQTPTQYYNSISDNLYPAKNNNSKNSLVSWSQSSTNIHNPANFNTIPTQKDIKKYFVNHAQWSDTKTSLYDQAFVQNAKNPFEEVSYSNYSHQENLYNWQNISLDQQRRPEYNYPNNIHSNQICNPEYSQPFFMQNQQNYYHKNDNKNMSSDQYNSHLFRDYNTNQTNNQSNIYEKPQETMNKYNYYNQHNTQILPIESNSNLEIKHAKPQNIVNQQKFSEKYKTKNRVCTYYNFLSTLKKKHAYLPGINSYTLKKFIQESKIVKNPQQESNDDSNKHKFLCPEIVKMPKDDEKEEIKKKSGCKNYICQIGNNSCGLKQSIDTNYKILNQFLLKNLQMMNESINNLRASNKNYMNKCPCNKNKKCKPKIEHKIRMQLSNRSLSSENVFKKKYRAIKNKKEEISVSSANPKISSIKNTEEEFSDSLSNQKIDDIKNTEEEFSDSLSNQKNETIKNTEKFFLVISPNLKISSIKNTEEEFSVSLSNQKIEGINNTEEDFSDSLSNQKIEGINNTEEDFSDSLSNQKIDKIENTKNKFADSLSNQKIENIKNTEEKGLDLAIKKEQSDSDREECISEQSNTTVSAVLINGFDAMNSKNSLNDIISLKDDSNDDKYNIDEKVKNDYTNNSLNINSNELDKEKNVEITKNEAVKINKRKPTRLRKKNEMPSIVKCVTTRAKKKLNEDCS